MSSTPSVRSLVTSRRTYNRPLNADGTVFETWKKTVARTIGHQRWLWERAKGSPLSSLQELELAELQVLMEDRKVSLSGRTLWLGGTDVAKEREASQFNCSFGVFETVHDVVDGFWLLLQGCGVGGKASNGTLNGFAIETPIEIIRSKLTLDDWKYGVKGHEENREERYSSNGYLVWHLRVGDSAAAWAKAVGKLLAMKDPVDLIKIDFSAVRAAGIRLSGYGWISSGDEQISKAMVGISGVMNEYAGQLLPKMAIQDIMNWLGTTLSSRRSAELFEMDFHDKEWMQFATWKKDYWKIGQDQRAQSNNTTLFYQRPSKLELKGIFQLMAESGGSEPAFANAVEALRRAPWFKGFNPCAEILLGNKSFCNLVETNVAAFNGDWVSLQRAHHLVARANYRQTCVDLDDGVLQRTWHELNQFLRLTGVGVTGVVGWEHATKAELWKSLRRVARYGVNSMADELGLPRSKAVTTVKPSGTLSKVMDTTEGVHKPLGKYIFNNIQLSSHDPLVQQLRLAGYYVFDHPSDPSSKLARMPVVYEDVEFDEVERDGQILHINQESAIDQLERYKLLMDNYVDHNCSITVSYSPDEVPAIIDWLFENWDSYVGVSWLYRTDPTMTPEDLGYPYLPQEVVTKERYDAYVATLQPLDLDAGNGFHELLDAECATGACPVR